MSYFHENNCYNIPVATMQHQPIHKLYCYVDETGQDTRGWLFVVVAIIAVKPHEVAEQLEATEVISGKGKVKWHRARKSADAYLVSALDVNIRFKAYYQVFTGSALSYELTTVQAAANAIDAYCASQEIEGYKATIVIDGLHRSLQHRTGKLLRSLGIRTKSVRGERDETSPIIRLADAVAGLVRESHEGNAQFKAIREHLEAQDVLKKLP